MSVIVLRGMQVESVIILLASRWINDYKETKSDPSFVTLVRRQCLIFGSSYSVMAYELRVLTEMTEQTPPWLKMKAGTRKKQKQGVCDGTGLLEGQKAAVLHDGIRDAVRGTRTIAHV